MLDSCGQRYVALEKQFQSMSAATATDVTAKDTERLNKVVTTKRNLSSNAMAGAVAGFTSSVVTHPLDVVKTRFQVTL